MTGELRDIVKYAYLDPECRPSLRRTLFWHCRAKVIGDPKRRKTFWYITANPKRPELWKYGTKGKPDNADRCLYRLTLLRTAVREHAATDVLMWTEGEKDADTAWNVYRVAATSHHGGAGKATQEQAEHFRGYRGTVWVITDNDDAGRACAYRRYRLLRRVGVRVELKAPAVQGPLVAAEGVPQLLIPSGGDLTDHADAGAALEDLRPERPELLRKVYKDWNFAVATGNAGYTEEEREFAEYCRELARQAAAEGRTWRRA